MLANAKKNKYNRYKIEEKNGKCTVSKVLTFKCAECGDITQYQVGATSMLATWQDAMAMVSDEKETDKLVEAYMKVSHYKGEAAMTGFAMNPAEFLTNINYEALGVDLEPLFDEQARKASEPVFNAKVQAQIADSHMKWLDALSRDGIVAFKALYICPKTRRLKQGLYLRMRWQEDKKERIVSYTNKCDECGSPLVLADDCNMGFCYEGQPTTAKCGRCGGTLLGDHTTFNK